MKKPLIVLTTLLITIILTMSGCLEQFQTTEKYLGTLDIADYTVQDKYGENQIIKIWSLKTDNDTYYLTKNKEFISISEFYTDFLRNDEVSVTGYVHYVTFSETGEKVKCLEVNKIDRILAPTHTVIYSGSGGTDYTAGTGLRRVGNSFRLDTNIFNQNLNWDGTFINATGGNGSNIFDQNLNISDDVVFNKITSNFFGDGGNLTNISGGWFDITRIWNTNNNSYSVSFSNLQTAINDLNNQSGAVFYPVNDITLTDTLWLSGNLEFFGYGNGSILTLGNNANVTMIKNYPGRDNIKIHNIRLEGNGLNQEEFLYSGYWSDCNHGIHLTNCDNAEIYEVAINNTHSLGILIEQSRLVNIHDCYLSKNGWLYEQSGNDLAHYPGSGIYYYATDDSVIDNCIINNPYGCGIIIESTLSASYDDWSTNCTVSNCYVSHCTVAYYFEDAKYDVLDGCIAVNCTETGIWGAGGGVRCAPDTNYISVSDLIIYGGYYGLWISGTNHTFDNIIIFNTNNDGIYDDSEDSIYSHIRINHTTSEGIYTQGYRNTIKDCEIWNPGSHGIYPTGDADYTRLIDNKIFNSGSYGIYAYADNIDVDGNYISGSTYRAIELYSTTGGRICNNFIFDHHSYEAIRLNGAENFTVFNNYIDDCNYGIREVSTADNNIIIFNTVKNFVTTAISISGGNSRINCTGLDDWNFYLGVS